MRLGQSVTKGVVSLSGGEAEWYAATRAAVCGTQLQQVLTEIGCQLPPMCTKRFSRSL